MVKDVVSVPIQSVTIRTGDTNLSPEEIEQKKVLKEAKDKADNNAEVENDRLAKQSQKEERERLKKVVFLKDGGKAKLVEVTTGIADDSDIEIKSGVKQGDEVISGSYSAISRKLKDGAKVVMEKPGKK
jgi:HlyD family secretion protein